MAPLATSPYFPSCLAASGDKATKSCTTYSYRFAVADPHPTCLKHNTTCFRQYEYTPEGCIHCFYLITRYKEGHKNQQAVFLARIDAMQHKICYLARSNPDQLPERVKTRFLAGDKNPFAPHLRHLDPRSRTARSLTRERSSYADSPHQAETWEEDEEGIDGYPDDPPGDEYDPLNPELSIPPEFLNDFFLVPDEAIVYNDYIDFLGTELDTADFEWGTHRGCNTCKPFRWSIDIEQFLRQAARVTSKPDASESRTKLFHSISKIIYKPALTHLGLVSHPTKPFTVATGRPSRFLGGLGDDTPFEPPPFFLCHQDTVSNRALALDFAAAPKFSRDSHKLPGLLSPHSHELPDTLRSRDFKARAHLLSLINAHESARYASTISDEELKGYKHMESQLAMALRMSERITANYTIPLLQSAITEALASAVAIRKEIRTQALQGCKSNIIQITLQGRSLLCPTLFHPEAITQAKECAGNAPPPPPVLHENIDGGHLLAPMISTSEPHHGGGPKFPAK